MGFEIDAVGCVVRKDVRSLNQAEIIPASSASAHQRWR
jgi:hypothetical protein